MAEFPATSGSAFRGAISRQGTYPLLAVAASPFASRDLAFIRPARLFKSALTALALIGIFLVTGRLTSWDRGAWLVAMIALSRNWLGKAGVFTIDPIIYALIFLAWLLIAGLWRPKGRWLWAGAAFGLAWMAKGTALLLLAGLIGAVAWRLAFGRDRIRLLSSARFWMAGVSVRGGHGRHGRAAARADHARLALRKRADALSSGRAMAGQLEPAAGDQSRARLARDERLSPEARPRGRGEAPDPGHGRPGAAVRRRLRDRQGSAEGALGADAGLLGRPLRAGGPRDGPRAGLVGADVHDPVRPRGIPALLVVLRDHLRLAFRRDVRAGVRVVRGGGDSAALAPAGRTPLADSA